MKKIFTLAILSLIIISFIGIVSATSGAIWTTRDDCGDETQNVNLYDIGDVVYVNGANFDAGEYDWEIKGQPGQASCDPGVIVAFGSHIVDETGDFCFNAYTVQIGDCKEYKVNFNSKHDNYHVIPEFGFFVGVFTILSAMVVFFVIRRQ